MPRKRSITIDGHRTSFSLEDEFWTQLQNLAAIEGVSVAAFVRSVDRERGTKHNLSSALRLRVLSALVAADRKD